MTTVVVGAVGADFGAAIYAEYRLARSVRTAANLSFDPWVSILGFPFSSQAMRHICQEVELKASGVGHPVAGKVGVEAPLHSLDLSDPSWLVGPDDRALVGERDRWI